MSYSIQLAKARHVPKIAEITNLEAERSAATVAASDEPIERWQASYQETQRYSPWLVAIKHDDQSLHGERVIGYAKASPYNSREGFNWSVALSIYISEAHKRQGIGEALYHVLFELLVKQGYLNVYARIALPNPGSQTLHERFGLTQTGVLPRFAWKFGRWHDMAIYTGMLREQTETTLSPVRTVESTWPLLKARLEYS